MGTSALIYIIMFGILDVTFISKAAPQNQYNSTEITIAELDIKSKQRQLFFGLGKETSTPDFIRLVIMRLLYGIASSMGIEDRLENVFNGAFVPPNADDGISFGDFGSDGAEDGLFGDLFGNDVI